MCLPLRCAGSKEPIKIGINGASLSTRHDTIARTKIIISRARQSSRCRCVGVYTRASVSFLLWPTLRKQHLFHPVERETVLRGCRATPCSIDLFPPSVCCLCLCRFRSHRPSRVPRHPRARRHRGCRRYVASSLPRSPSSSFRTGRRAVVWFRPLGYIPLVAFSPPDLDSIALPSAFSPKRKTYLARVSGLNEQSEPAV